MSQRYAAITGWGRYLPERVLSNADLERMVETNDEWIVSRTGIRERRIAAPHETTSTMATAAARAALTEANLTPADVELVIVATITPDYLFPSTACLVQHQLGVPTTAGAFDLNAACTGFVYALGTAAQFIRAGAYRRVLVIGAETLSRFTDYTDRRTCILFGDGAGAVVLEACDAERGPLSLVLRSDGAGGPLLGVPGLGAAQPASAAVLAAGGQYMHMDGGEIYKFAVRAMGDAAAEATEAAGLSWSQVDMLIPHQANLRIIDAAARRLDLPRERVWVNIEHYGNTSAASIPICLSEAADAGALHDGMNLVLVAVGGGLTWGASVVRWGRGS